MPIITTYTCDKCQRLVDKDAIWAINVRVTRNTNSNPYISYQDLNTVWCEHCIAKAGFIKRDFVKPPAAKITIEDLIRELISETTGAV